MRETRGGPFAIALCGFLAWGLFVAPAQAQLLGRPAGTDGPEATIVNEARQVFIDIMSIPAKGIPQGLIANCEGLVIVPGLLKGGFVVGVRHGRGILTLRDERGAWRPPQFLSITGGSVGWQAGLQATDLILVFRTKNSVKGLLSGKFTLGAGVSAAAGPIGREASAATDLAFKAEILSYSRSRGLFGGIALDGSTIHIDADAGSRYYQAAGPGATPPSAARLLEELARYTAAPAAAPAPNTPHLQAQLAQASLALQALLDETWRQHLALPPETYTPDRQPVPDALAAALARFDAVAANPQYQNLTSRVEFRTTHALLRQCLGAPGAAIPLPPPPR